MQHTTAGKMQHAMMLNQSFERVLHYLSTQLVEVMILIVGAALREMQHATLVHHENVARNGFLVYKNVAHNDSISRSFLSNGALHISSQRSRKMQQFAPVFVYLCSHAVLHSNIHQLCNISALPDFDLFSHKHGNLGVPPSDYLRSEMTVPSRPQMSSKVNSDVLS